MLLARFAVVGASGVLVNLFVLVVVRRLGPHFEDVLIDLPGTEFNVRWYHLYSTVAFLVANLWNFQLNRSLDLPQHRPLRWWREYWPFLAVGLAGQALGLRAAHRAAAPGLAAGAARPRCSTTRAGCAAGSTGASSSSSRW